LDQQVEVTDMYTPADEIVKAVNYGGISLYSQIRKAQDFQMAWQGLALMFNNMNE
jgi:hypothetical protein